VDINKIKEGIAEVLIKLADEALYQAKSTYSTWCSFHSVDAKVFQKGTCPECGNKELIPGRNKITRFGDSWV
jgi:hypothetical protein